MERAGESVEHAVGDAAHVPALEARVVLDADPRKQCHLFAAQPGDAAVLAVDRQPDPDRVTFAPRDVRNSRIPVLVSSSD